MEDYSNPINTDKWHAKTPDQQEYARSRSWVQITILITFILTIAILGATVAINAFMFWVILWFVGICVTLASRWLYKTIHGKEAKNPFK